MSMLKPLTIQRNFTSGCKACTNIIVEASYETRQEALETELISLLSDCFDGVHEGRTFFKQEPHQRLLAFSGEHLIGHLGLDFRMIRIGEALVSISGIVDLCVHQDYRGYKLASDLLTFAEQLSANRDFVVLMADDDRLYRRNDYLLLANTNVRWLAIDELRSHSIMQRDFSDNFMYKSMKKKCWPEGHIDLLGYLF